MKKYFILLTSSFLLLTACSVGQTGDGVTYKHANIPCPPPQAMPQEVAVGFNQYAGDPLMMNFYQHYLQQQQQLTAYRQHNPNVPNCPPSFWVENRVADVFHDLPEGHPMREFFKSYVAEQRAIDAYYDPNSARPE